MNKTVTLKLRRSQEYCPGVLKFDEASWNSWISTDQQLRSLIGADWGENLWGTNCSLCEQMYLGCSLFRTKQWRPVRILSTNKSWKVMHRRLWCQRQSTFRSEFTYPASDGGKSWPVCLICTEARLKQLLQFLWHVGGNLSRHGGSGSAFLKLLSKLVWKRTNQEWFHRTGVENNIPVVRSGKGGLPVKISMDVTPKLHTDDSVSIEGDGFSWMDSLTVRLFRKDSKSKSFWCCPPLRRPS